MQMQQTMRLRLVLGSSDRLAVCWHNVRPVMRLERQRFAQEIVIGCMISVVMASLVLL